MNIRIYPLFNNPSGTTYLRVTRIPDNTLTVIWNPILRKPDNPLRESRIYYQTESITSGQGG